MRDESKAKQH